MSEPEVEDDVQLAEEVPVAFAAAREAAEAECLEAGVVAFQGRVRSCIGRGINAGRTCSGSPRVLLPAFPR